MSRYENIANEKAVYQMLNEAFGLSPEFFNSGGGCMVYEAKLEGGDILCITEGEDFISPYRWRMDGWIGRDTGELLMAGENAGNPWGWTVGIYHPDPEYPDSRDESPYAGAVDHSAFFDDLVGVVRMALSAAVAAARTGEMMFVVTERDGTVRRSNTLWGYDGHF